MSKEIWKSVCNYEGRYMTSSIGRVSSLLSGFKILSTPINSHGYKYVLLYKDGKRKTCKVHRLVAEAFIKNEENKPSVNHINGIKTDNRVENLEWCTQSENVIHARENGLVQMVKGENNGRAKLVDEHVKNIRLLYATGFFTQKELGDYYGVGQTTISEVVLRKKWNHIN